MNIPNADDRDLLVQVHATLNEVFNGDARSSSPHGFVLLVFPHDGEPSRRTNHVSNCGRADMIAAMEEVIARLRGQLQ